MLPPKLATLQKTLEYLSAQHERQQQAGNLSYYIFNNDKLCGFIGTKSVEYSNKTELTYWLTKESQGKGFMRAALKSVEQEHFKNTSNTLVGVILRNAQRSARLLSNCGYELKMVTYIKTKLMYDAQAKQAATLHERKLKSYQSILGSRGR